MNVRIDFGRPIMLKAGLPSVAAAVAAVALGLNVLLVDVDAFLPMVPDVVGAVPVVCVAVEVVELVVPGVDMVVRYRTTVVLVSDLHPARYLCTSTTTKLRPSREPLVSAQL